ncbi:MAG: SDR family oxidoreductase [Rhodococcus sp. (in: high G+C Gram-positive bacteria)]|uniref:SDR family oxidoreductase n=1 Tax=Rhodococcus sp. TaxID=1831 RepID=UPI001224C2EB|nr:SDR family oxidoreductase [Rhodococcus sp. (in: high G+C Gram-positive bacteria)]RZL24153.1 MAG: SDR family oxidoreductase [Rhodococcus sp. (in: high G+C Gram-positive bacteria)]
MPRFEPNPARRTALISGASSGIGTAAAYALAELGHRVVLGARREAECEAIAEKIRSNGGEAMAHFLDVTDGSSVDACVTAAEKAMGPVEIVVSGAGDLEFGAADQMEPERFLRQVEVHLVGAQRLAHRILPGMRERQRGDFVLIGSDCADRQRPLMGAYDASKAGLEAMGRQMRMELEGTGIRASIVRPGPTLTGMGMDTTPEIIGPVGESWARWGFARHGYMLRPSDIANAIVAVVNAPRGAHLVLVEVQPEAPLNPRPTHTSQETT